MTTINNITRTNGALSFWEEDGEEFTVTLNASSKPASIQSKRGRWIRQECAVKYDSAGKFIGLTGDLKTLMLPDLIADANGGVKAVTDTSGNVTGLVGPGGVTVPLYSEALSKPTAQQLGNFKWSAEAQVTQLTLPNPYSGQPNEPVHPGILFFAGGWCGYRYWMCFTPYPSADSTYENPSVVASNDFVTWVAPTTNPLVHKPSGVGYNADNHLFMSPDGLTMYLCFRERNVGNANNLKVMETTNGRTWTQPVAVLTGTLAVQDFASPSIFWNGTSWTCISHNLDGGAPWPVEQRTSVTASVYGAWSAATTVSIPPLSGRAWWHSFFLRSESGQVFGLMQDNNKGVGNSGSLYLVESGDNGLTFGRVSVVATAGNKYRSCFFLAERNGETLMRTVVSDFSTRTLSFVDVNPAQPLSTKQTVVSRGLLALPGFTNGPVKLVDKFTRADSAVTVGTAESGQTYTVTGTWGILSNSAYAVATGNITVDLSSTAYRYGVQFAGMQTAVQLWALYRFASSTDYWRIGVLNPSASGAQTLTLQSVVGGAVQLNTSIGNITRGDHLGIVNTPSGFRVYVNDDLVHTRVDSLHCQATSVGLRANSMTVGGFKYLTCESLA